MRARRQPGPVRRRRGSANKGAASPPLYPAADPNVIAVTATDERDRLYEAANRGKHIALSAPGVDIVVPVPDNGFVSATGTSFAAAHVAGVAALLIAQKPSRTPDDIAPS